MIFDESKLVIREATLKDVDFIVTTIIEAEKSSTNKVGTANYFGITESEYRQYLTAMLEEEVDGCEISISSYILAEYDGNIVAAKGGWLEGDNEDNMPSSILKSNLFAYTIPMGNLKKGQANIEIVKGIQIDRELGTYQLENFYTHPNFRGHHIMNNLDTYHIDKARLLGAQKIQIHVYGCNKMSIKTCERSGFKVVEAYKSSHPRVKELYPDDTMLLMEKVL